MIISLPIFLNGKLEYQLTTEREPCSNECLINTSDLYAFHTPGLGSAGVTHLFYPLLTNQKTIIKKKKNERIRWSKLSYDYEIVPHEQTEIYNKLIENPSLGVVQIVKQCKCSYETEFVKGDLSFSNSLPVTKHYQNNFQFISNWNQAKLIDFISKSSDILIRLHQNNLIHGDATAQNFMITDYEEVRLIDLDTLVYGNEELYLQEVASYCLYTICPIVSSFESPQTTKYILNNIFDKILNTQEYNPQWGQILISCILDNTSSNMNHIIPAYLFNINVFSDFVEDYYSVVNRVQQLQIELLEANRVKDTAMNEQKKIYKKQFDEASNYALSLEKHFSDATEYAKSIEIHLLEAAENIKSLEKSNSEQISYSKVLETQVDEMKKELEEMKKEEKMKEDLLSNKKKFKFF